ncbi:carboxypeptidase regulatory-like domain-containing protein [Telmatocola sphagniphila]|uniref:Carboxypeptidase regulatory-like domain-containing protein n=1 Tax=Telmatocola sphagniphila TaxID=1123043 RepID=A0A8E6B8L3_9BACT|nr:carboxypeptidase-like regulatory domain-containing protein [Telmatocola sphagniphila]QVL34140.1 carboxypeptidase regulatory-like domain-containing protein [Telmatocola sphagniphila]
MKRFILGVASAIFVLTQTGCSSENGKYIPVTGKLQVDGQPAEGAQVTLVPTNSSIGESTFRPTGLVDADGSYKLTTYDPSRSITHEGVPPGEYKVTITWIPLLQPGENVDSKKRPVDRLGGKYLDPAKSPYPVVIKEPRMEMDPINLKLLKRS